jgi:hypothetical protein
MDAPTLKRFVNEECELGPSFTVPAKDLREAYNAWHGGAPVYKNFIGLVESLEGCNFHHVKRRIYEASRKLTNVYTGIRLKKAVDAPIVDLQEAESLEANQQEMQYAPAVVEPMDMAQDAEAAVESTRLEHEDCPDGQTVLVLRGDQFHEFKGARIRKTGELPPRISILDLIQAVTGVINPSASWANLSERMRGLNVALPDIGMYQFPGARQRETPIADARGVVHIIFFLPGPRAAAFCYKCSDLIVRYLGGDESLIDEIRQTRVAREQLPGDHLLRVFAPSPQNVWSSFEVPLERCDQGVVYTATSPHLPYVKIGMWTGTEKMLTSRYATYYGQSVNIKSIPSADCRLLERSVHIALSDFLFEPGRELYKKGAVDYIEVIRQLQQEQDN